MITLLLNVITIHCFAVGAPPQKIVALNPAVTEILYALKAQGKIVGTVAEANWPQEATKLPRVGTYSKPNLEKIVALKPDLVVTFKEGIDQTSAVLQRSKIKYLALEARTLADYPKFVRALAEEIGHQADAAALLGEWERTWGEISKVAKPHSIMIQLDTDPAIFAAQGTFLSDLIERCGHKNTLDKLTGYPKLSRESLIKFRPDIILALPEPALNAASKVEAFWKKVPQKTPARLVVFDPRVISLLGPRLPGAAKQLCMVLQGDL